MKASVDVIDKLELLLEAYEKEVSEKLRSGIISSNTAKTYLLHSNNFVRWCKDEFSPGSRNL